MRAFSVFLALLIGGSIVSCTKNHNDKQDLRIHLPVVKLNLDPQKMEDAYSMAIVGQLYRGLLRYDLSGDVKNDLAKSWTESSDRLKYQFELRDDARFSNGKPITATNVQMTFARMFKLGASMAGDIDYIEGAEDFKKTGDLSKFGVTALSPTRVEFRLSKPSAIFLKQLAVVDCSILPLDNFGDELDISALGSFSGPFKMSSISEKAVSVVRWRKDSFDSKNPPEAVTYNLTDKSLASLALADRTDTVDHDKISADTKSILESKRWAAVPTELAHEIFIILNPSISPKARQALFASVKPEEILGQIGTHSYKPAFGLIPFGLSGDLSIEDIAPLKKLRDHSNFKEKLSIDYEANSELEESTAKILRKRWTELGFTVTLNPLSKKDKLGKMFGKKSQILIGRKAMDYPDGFSVLGYFKGKYESNYFYVDDPKIDQELSKVLEIFDSELRANKYKEIQKMILAHYTVIPLYFGSEASGLWGPKVKFVPSHPLGYHTLPLETVEMASQ
jgi:ABC-type transport system substrate-binding protein